MRPVAHQPISFVQDGSIPVPVPPPEPSLGYGLLYNWYAATDVRGIAPDGWRVPTASDMDSLITEVGAGGNNILRGVRSIGADLSNPVNHPGWISSNLGTDDLGFAFYAFGIRLESGNYRIWATSLEDDDQTGVILTTSIQGSAPNEFYTSYRMATSLDEVIKSTFGGALKTQGSSIRCLRDTTPPSSIVEDADGNAYTWVQIGAQYWLAQNLRTTKYNNGDDIPTGLNNPAWKAATDGAYALPNGDATLPI